MAKHKKKIAKRKQKNKRKLSFKKIKSSKNITIYFVIYFIAALLILDSALTFISNLPFIANVNLIFQIQIIIFSALATLQIFGAYWLIKLKLKGFYIAVGLSLIALAYEILVPTIYGWFLFYFLPKDAFIVFYLIKNRNIFN